MADTTGSGLTDKQTRFVDEYLVDFNATQAAIRAGYAEKGAYNEGYRLLRNVEIARRIAELGQQTADELGMTRGYVFSKLQEALEKALAETPKFHKGDPLYGPDGNLIVEINAGAAKSLLELLAKLRGDLSDKVIHEGGIDIRVNGVPLDSLK